MKIRNCFGRRLVMRKVEQGEDELRRIWKEYFEDLYNIDTQEKVHSG